MGEQSCTRPNAIEPEATMPLPLDSAPSTLWVLWRDGKTASADVRFVPNGVELRVLRDATLLWSRIFAGGEEALQEAGEEQQRLSVAGWIAL